jgi:hypothetical protein
MLDFELELDQLYLEGKGRDHCGFTEKELSLMSKTYEGEIDESDLEFLVERSMFHSIKKFIRPGLAKPHHLNKCRYLAIAKLLNVKPVDDIPLNFAIKIDNQNLINYYKEILCVTRKEQLVAGSNLDASRFECDDLTIDELRIATTMGYKLRSTILNEVILKMQTTRSMKLFTTLIARNNLEFVRHIIQYVDNTELETLPTNIGPELLTFLLENNFKFVKVDYIHFMNVTLDTRCVLVRHGYRHRWNMDIKYYYEAYKICNIITDEIMDYAISVDDHVFLARIPRDEYDWSTRFVKKCSFDTLQILVVKGFNIHTIDPRYKKTIMHHAIEKRDEVMVKFLIDHGLDLNHVDHKNKTYKDYAAKSASILDLLVKPR